MTQSMTKAVETVAKYIGAVLAIGTLVVASFTFGVFLTLLRSDVNINSSNINEIKIILKDIQFSLRQLELANQRNDKTASVASNDS